MSNNTNVVLIVGPPSSGKSSCLMGMKDQEKWVYLNTDLKALPFKDKFAANVMLDNATYILDYIDQIEDNPDIQGGIIDTITYLMKMYERQNVVGAKNGLAAWGEYGNFYNQVLEKVKTGTKDYIILAHTSTETDPNTGESTTVVPIKGAVGKLGMEGDFTTILSAKQVKISKLNGVENDLLHVSDDEREDGLKHVFVTRLNKDYSGEKTRSAVGLWARPELYIDNNIAQVMDRLHSYYA